MTPPSWIKLGLAGLLLAAVGWAVLAHAEVRRLSHVTAQAAACDEALATPDRAAALFAIRASCTPPVVREVAARAAADGDAASARAALDAELGEAASAVERAEARGLQSIQRRTTADETIRAAPGTVDRRRCDADCLRSLGG